MEQIYTPKQDYKLLCYCITYNQAKYIEDTLNGFAMQKTNFPFVCLVVEDCSTDGEQDVIKAWLERECDMSKAEYVDLELSGVILVPHRTNENCTFAIYLLKRNLWKEPKLKTTLIEPWREHAEYEAWCEGDDYWISPTKLQKQICFLDQNPEYTLCFHNAIRIYEDESTPSRLFNSIWSSRRVDFSEIVGKWIIPTASIVVRTTVFPFPEWTKEIYSGDQTLALLAANKGMLYAIKDIMSVYRINYGESATSMLSKKPHDFATKAHLILYRHFEEYSQHKFSNVVLPHIKYLEEEVKLINNRNRYGLGAFFFQPVFCIKKVIEKYNHLLYDSKIYSR